MTNAPPNYQHISQMMIAASAEAISNDYVSNP